MLLIFAIVVLAIIAGILAISFVDLLKKIRSSDHENMHLREKMHQRALDLVEEARRSSIHIMEQAHLKAQDIIQSAKTYDQGLDAKVNQTIEASLKQNTETFQKRTQELLSTYETMLSKIKQENINMVQNISKELESEALSEVKDFKGTLEHETINSQKAIEEKINAAYLEMQKELQAYKQDQLDQIDRHIYQVLQMVSEDVLGHMLRIEEHEDLIMDSLKQAKAQLALPEAAQAKPAPQQLAAAQTPKGTEQAGKN